MTDQGDEDELQKLAEVNNYVLLEIAKSIPGGSR